MEHPFAIEFSSSTSGAYSTSIYYTQQKRKLVDRQKTPTPDSAEKGDVKEEYVQRSLNFCITLYSAGMYLKTMTANTIMVHIVFDIFEKN